MRHLKRPRKEEEKSFNEPASHNSLISDKFALTADKKRKLKCLVSVNGREGGLYLPAVAAAVWADVFSEPYKCSPKQFKLFFTLLGSQIKSEKNCFAQFE